MTDDSDDLDDHQDISAQKAAEVRRRRLHGFQPNQTDLRRREEELKEPVLTAPPETWPEAAATAQYLLYSFSPPHRRRKIRPPRNSSRVRSSI